MEIDNYDFYYLISFATHKYILSKRNHKDYRSYEADISNDAKEINMRLYSENNNLVFEEKFKISEIIDFIKGV